MLSKDGLTEDVRCSEGSGVLAAKVELFIRRHCHSFPPSIDRCVGERIWSRARIHTHTQPGRGARG